MAIVCGSNSRQGVDVRDGDVSDVNEGHVDVWNPVDRVLQKLTMHGKPFFRHILRQ